jgi:hypothetical protein
VLTADISGKLHQQACVAQADVKRIEDLGVIESFLRNVALA